jgi:hypothetical protein
MRPSLMAWSTPPRPKQMGAHRVAPSPPQHTPATNERPPPTKAWHSSGSGLSQSDDAASLRSELNHATERIANLELQLQTVRGRDAALHVAKNSTNPRWAKAAARRFKFVPEGNSEFANETLHEMLKQALVGVRRRMDEALQACSRAREHSLLAEVTGLDRLDEAAAQFKDPNAEHALATAARAFALRTRKECDLLRTAMQALENEVREAQNIHATDMRSIAARLLAQRDCIQQVLHAELRDAEVDGSQSVHALQLEIRHLKEASTAALQARDAEIASLASRLADQEHVLAAERAARCQESKRHAVELQLIRGPIDELEGGVGNAAADLVRSLKERNVLAIELAAEEEARRADSEAASRRLQHEVDRHRLERRETEQRLNASLQANGLQQQTERAEKEAIFSKAQALEKGLLGQLKRLGRAKEKSEAELQAQVELLTAQVTALRASKSVRRSYLYWSGMRAKGGSAEGGAEKAHEELEALRLADPRAWRKPALPLEALARGF